MLNTYEALSGKDSRGEHEPTRAEKHKKRKSNWVVSKNRITIGDILIGNGEEIMQAPNELTII